MNWQVGRTVRTEINESADTRDVVRDELGYPTESLLILKGEG